MIRDILKNRNLPKHWLQAIKDAKGVANPWRDLDHTRPERSRAAFVVISWGNVDKLEHPKVKEYIRELEGL